MSMEPLYINAVGMACPVGLTAAAASAAMRAGINRRQELSFVDDAGNVIIGSALSLLPANLSANQRRIRLLSYALRDLFSHRPLPHLRQVPILIALSDDASDCAMDSAVIADALRTATSLESDPWLIEIIRGGSSVGYRAIARAQALLLSGRYRACVVAAADSLLDARRLLMLQEQRRLLTEDNPDGVTPGEAAACLLVEAAPGATAATIRGLGFFREPSLRENEVPMRGDGATTAARMALAAAGLSMYEMDFRLSDAAGESSAFKELVIMTTRLLHQPKAEFPLWLMADCLGDVGAASGLCSIVWAIIGFQRGYARGRRAISVAASDDGDRAALVLDAQCV